MLGVTRRPVASASSSLAPSPPHARRQIRVLRVVVASWSNLPASEHEHQTGDRALHDRVLALEGGQGLDRARATRGSRCRRTPDTVTDSFNRVCAELQGEPDPAFQRAARKVLASSEW